MSTPAAGVAGTSGSGNGGSVGGNSGGNSGGSGGSNGGGGRRIRMRIGTGRVRSETTRSRLRTGRIETYTVPLSPLFESARDGAADRLGQAVDDRGSLDIHPSVLRKIAVRAVGSVPEASSGSTVKVRESGENVVDVVVRLALHYPSPVRQAAAEVRRSVADEVERLTGYHVRDVDVTVSALRPPVRSRVG